MKRFVESAWAVWCFALIITAIGLGISKVDWPSWKDPFWSSWAQCVGALGAIVVAFQVGRAQVKAAEKLRRDELDDEHRLALQMVIQGIHEAMDSMRALSSQPLYQAGKPLRAPALASLADAERMLVDCLRMKLPRGTRSKVWEAKAQVHAIWLSLTLTTGPYADCDRTTIEDRIAILDSIAALITKVGMEIGAGR